MLKPGANERVYRVVKIPTILQALAAQGVPAGAALARTGLTEADLRSPETLISAAQIVAVYRNARDLAKTGDFALRTGLRFHVSTFGMYGFAILSSTDFRKSMAFAVQYYELTSPITEVSFCERDKMGIWTIAPLPHPHIDAALARFIVEMHLSMTLSLLRDVMGAAFVPAEVCLTFPRPPDTTAYAEAFATKLSFDQPANELRFDARRLDETPVFGNHIAYQTVHDLCDRLLEELTLRVGMTGKVRHVVMTNLMRPMPFDTVAASLHMSARTLRRRLEDEDTSYREIVDGLRKDLAIKYLRDTALTVEEIANALGFSDAANFRQAFRRWTNAAPQRFRSAAQGVES